MSFQLTTTTGGGLSLSVGSKLLFKHSPEAPGVFAGFGRERMEMYRGNFDVEDRLCERAALRIVTVSVDGTMLTFRSSESDAREVCIRVSEPTPGRIDLTFKAADPAFNRFWIRIPANPDEAVWGCGEQMSYFNLRGRNFPLWTSEPGVGRDKTTDITFQSDVTGKAGGNYFTTNYPEPTYLSSAGYALHMETTAYADFDFRDPEFHELQVWHKPNTVSFEIADTLPDLVGRLSKRFGRQASLPSWVDTGVIVGLKRGDRSFELLEEYTGAGVPVSGLWCEDWAGVRDTSFGRRLFWNWQWDETRYPDLPAKIAALKNRGIRFLTYVSPYLCTDGSLYPEGVAANAFARTTEGDIYHVDFGEYDCGVIDFTNPEAAKWFRERVLQTNMLDLGIDGWMADFGEYLPIDLVLHDGSDPRLMHNAWPPMWAKLNAEAMAARNMQNEGLFFMRAGYAGNQRHCQMLWAGDQSVDFSRHDGLVTAICGALSSGLMGHAYHHSDIGGYTSLFGNVRTKELFDRWAEFSAFTCLMRTHECNRPDDNFQAYQDADTLRHLARMARIFMALTPYRRALMDEAVLAGLPLQRPLVLHFEDDPATYSVFDSYLLGPDLLIAPVWREGAVDRSVYLPQGAMWRHLWSGTTFKGNQEVAVEAPMGQPPVFYRHGSQWANLFDSLTAIT